MRGNTRSRAERGFGLSGLQIWDVHHNANDHVQECSLIPIQEPPNSAAVIFDQEFEHEEECDARHQAQAGHARELCGDKHHVYINPNQADE